MKSRTSFTKKDVTVVAACVLFLLATVGSVGVSGRRRAKEAVCLSNLCQWGTVFLAFAADNDGYFMEGWTNEPVTGPPHTRYWMEALRPYYGNDHNLRCCAEAVVPGTELGQGQYGGAGTFTAWGVFSGECGEPSSGWGWVVACDYGSYGNNAWTCNPPPGENVWWGQQDFHWRTANVAGADEIPLFGGHQFLDCWPNHTDEPPQYEGQPWFEGSQMSRVCVNRHSGFVNWVFLDGSARKVGLKQLWRLKWHRTFDVDNGPEPGEWPEWMREFQDY
jgi:prepilin-type processing-associated H-X9-DG protein